jgi:hypothetical protein
MSQADPDCLAAERQIVVDAVLDGRIDRETGLMLVVSTESRFDSDFQKIIGVDDQGGAFIFDNDPDALDALLASRAASGAVNRMLGAMA